MMRLCLCMLLLVLAACEATPATNPQNIITETPLPPTQPLPMPTDLPPTETPIPTTINNVSALSAANVDLYSEPGGAVIRTVRSSAPVTLIGRTLDNLWLQVIFSDGVSGWVVARNIETGIDLNTLAITGEVSAVTIASPIPTLSSDARVRENAGGLRLRTAPDTESDVLANLDGLENLRVFGRTADNSWLRVEAPNGAVGWVAASFLEININLNQVAVVRNFATPTSAVEDNTPNVVGVVVGISDRAREVFRAGGNRANVFSKIGAATAPQVIYPIGRGALDRYGYLQQTVDYFSGETARDGHSFVNVSLAAGDGWTTESILNPANANPDACQPEESPLVCEYRVVRPAVALILLSTNDVVSLTQEAFRNNLRTIMQTSIDRGVIPILSTLPERQGANVAPFNQIIRDVATEYDMPLWDYASAMQTAPNNGLSGDGVNPSVAPGEPSESANFAQSFLQYGYNIRNLTALQVLDALRQNVLTNE